MASPLEAAFTGAYFTYVLVVFKKISAYGTIWPSIDRAFDFSFSIFARP
jgi:hypothetical protein